ncbi:MAG: hypothetical protein FJ086_03170 [Deltaproteobacteria bacterium]|nr:hypothetical protein [Deltaproteobacteria bacterium]
MRRRLTGLLYALALPAWAGALEERLAACQETFSDCREDCTTSYGSSFKLREQLGRCLDTCTRRKDECRGRHLELDQAQIDEDSFERKRPGQELANDPGRREVPAAPAPRRKASRMQPEAEPAPEAESAPAPAPEPAEPQQPEADTEEQAPRREEREERSERSRSSERAPAREETPAPPPPRAPARAAEPTAAAEEEAPPAAAPKPAEETDPSREGAKKLMKRGIEEWDPNAEE